MSSVPVSTFAVDHDYDRLPLPELAQSMNRVVQALRQLRDRPDEIADWNLEIVAGLLGECMSSAADVLAQLYWADVGFPALPVPLEKTVRCSRGAGFTRDICLTFVTCKAVIDSAQLGGGVLRERAEGLLIDCEARLNCLQYWQAIDQESADRVDESVPEMVTLRQMASIVNKSKRTLERMRNHDELPAPGVKGGIGQADEWEWHEVKPILEERFDRVLPNHFPSKDFVRR